MDFKSNSPLKVSPVPLSDKKLSINNDNRVFSEERNNFPLEGGNNEIEGIGISLGSSWLNKNIPIGGGLNPKVKANVAITQKNKGYTKLKLKKGSKSIIQNQNVFNLFVEGNSGKKEDLGTTPTIEKTKNFDKDRELYSKNLKLQKERSRKFLRDYGENNFSKPLSNDSLIGDTKDTKKKLNGLMESEFDNEKDHYAASPNSLDLVALDIEAILAKNKDKNMTNENTNAVNSNNNTINIIHNNTINNTINNNNNNFNLNKNTICNGSTNFKKLSKLPLIINKSTSVNPTLLKSQAIVFDFNPLAYLKKKAARGIKCLPEYFSSNINSNNNNINECDNLKQSVPSVINSISINDIQKRPHSECNYEHSTNPKINIHGLDDIIATNRFYLNKDDIPLTVMTTSTINTLPFGYETEYMNIISSDGLNALKSDTQNIYTNTSRKKSPIFNGPLSVSSAKKKSCVGSNIYKFLDSQDRIKKNNKIEKNNVYDVNKTSQTLRKIRLLAKKFYSNRNILSLLRECTDIQEPILHPVTNVNTTNGQNTPNFTHVSRVPSLSPATVRLLQNQFKNLVPPLQGNTYRLHQKSRVNQQEAKPKEHNISYTNSNMNISPNINEDEILNLRKEEEIEMIPNSSTPFNHSNNLTSKRMATESDLFAGTFTVRSILHKKNSVNYAIQSPESKNNNNNLEDDKNTSFTIAVKQAADNLIDSKNHKKGNRNGMFVSTKEIKSNSSIVLNSNTQPSIVESQKDNDNLEVMINLEGEKGIETPNKRNPRTSLNSNVYNPLSTTNSMKPTNLAKLQILTKKSNPIPIKSLLDQKCKDPDTLFANKILMYKDWILKINFSFNVIVKQPSQSSFVPYKYFIGKGNNRLLLKNLMKQRWWWIPAESANDPNINFLWTQLKQNPFLELLKNRKKLNNESNNSDMNLSTTIGDTLTSEKNNESITDQSDSDYDIGLKKNSIINNNNGNKPMANNTKVIVDKKKNDPKNNPKNDLFKGLTALHSKIMNKTDNLTILNYITTKQKSIFLEDEEELTKLNRKQGASFIIDQPNNLKMHNHIENNFHLSNKKAMFYNMRNYCEIMKKNVFDHLPLTFHVQNGVEDVEYKKFLEYFNNKEKEIQEQDKLIEELTKQNDKKNLANIKKLRNIWIIKPGENTNRGHGITVCNELNQIKDIITSNEIHPNGKKKTYIIQQYIDKPLLYNKRKFDIRCYIMITCINSIMRGYWYQDGYIRTASKEFTLKNVTNRMIHLTNDAVQKKSEEYGKYENGNKLSYSEFQRYLDNVYHDANINFMNDIYLQMKNLATDAIKSVYGKVDLHKKEHTFEVFGLDFMIDQNFKVWMIEINTNPCLELSSPHLARVIPAMVENALRSNLFSLYALNNLKSLYHYMYRISIDPMFPPPNWPSSKKHLLPDNLLENNKFEIIFDELEDGPALKNLAQESNQQLMDQIYEMEEEEDSGEDEKEDN